MNIVQTGFDGLYVLELPSFKDARGEFVKTIHKPTFEKSGLDFNFTESFYSVSKKDVLRGMHFQIPPEDHAKLVYVISGGIIDVVVDLRKQSKTFQQVFTIELNADNRKAIYIEKGFAHGFLALQDNSIVEYHTTTEQSKEHENGILWSSINYQWLTQSPIISERDKNFQLIIEFHSPF